MNPDGSNIKFQQIKFSNVGLVRSPLPAKSLLGLVLENGAGAFDIRTCIKTGIPSGTYHLAYGAMGDAKSPLPFFRIQKAVGYKIESDKTNMLRIGPPLQLVFFAEYKTATEKKKTVRSIGIRHPDHVIGVGGEMYGPISFPNAASPKGRPGLMIVQGSKSLFKTTMPVRNGKVGDFLWKLPDKLSPQGIKVVMAAHTPQLGKVMGIRTIKQIASKALFSPPKTDKPTVATTPWNKSGQAAQNTQPVKIVKTVKPKPKPTPSTRPRQPLTPKATGETKARGLVNLARNYKDMKLHAKAVEILESAIEKYPDTDAAASARKLLQSMK